MKLTIDDLEDDKGEVEPFVVDLGEAGVFEFPDVEDVSSDVLLRDFTMESGKDALRFLLGDEDFEAFVTAPGMTLGRVRVTIERYMKHYGMPSSGEGVASLPSSNRAARRSKQTSGSRRRAKAS